MDVVKIFLSHHYFHQPFTNLGILGLKFGLNFGLEAAECWYTSSKAQENMKLQVKEMDNLKKQALGTNQGVVSKVLYLILIYI